MARHSPLKTPNRPKEAFHPSPWRAETEATHGPRRRLARPLRQRRGAITLDSPHPAKELVDVLAGEIERLGDLVVAATCVTRHLTQEGVDRSQPRLWRGVSAVERNRPPGTRPQ